MSSPARTTITGGVVLARALWRSVQLDTPLESPEGERAFVEGVVARVWAAVCAGELVLLEPLPDAQVAELFGEVLLREDPRELAPLSFERAAAEAWLRGLRA